MKSTILTMLFFVVFLLKTIAQPAPLHKNNQDLFVSGMNLAWINYGNDLEGFDEIKFTDAIQAIRAAGGNTVRWWIHTEGTTSPIFTNGKVSGIKQIHLENLRTACDIAYMNGVMIDLCLWSFGMLDDANITASTITRNKNLLTDTSFTWAYINNALTPMVKFLKGHPGILCWEIFNESEGMISGYGWTSDRVSMKYVQQFINLCAGAIHRADSTAWVSNSSWQFNVCSDVGSFTNFYSPERLIAQGKDSLGYLDLYQVHYYSMNNPNEVNPFIHPASYWELDKPVIIGEFPAMGLSYPSTRYLPFMPTIDAYNYLYNNGYSGALAWTWTNHDGNGGLPDCAAALDNIRTLHNDTIDIIISPSFDYPPSLTKTIPGGWIYKGDTTDTITLGKVTDYFTDKDDSAFLTFQIDSQSSIANYLISPEKKIQVMPLENKTGIATVTVTATDTSGRYKKAPIVFSIIDKVLKNKLLYRNIYASSIESANLPASKAVDNSVSSRWASTIGKDNQWLLIKLDTIYELQRMLIYWELAHAMEYQVMVSLDSVNWDNVYTEKLGDGDYDKIVFDTVKASYVLLNCIKRRPDQNWGFSIYEISAYSDKAVNHSPVFITPDSVVTYNVNEPLNISVKYFVDDPDLGERLTFDIDSTDSSTLPAWLAYNDTTKRLSGTPSISDTGSYTLHLTVTDLEGAQASGTITINVINPTSIPIAGNLNVFDIYPVPAKNNINISWHFSNVNPVRISIEDYLGRTINIKEINQNRLYNNNNYSMNIDNIPAGLYIVKFQSGNISANKKILIIK